MISTIVKTQSETAINLQITSQTRGIVDMSVRGYCTTVDTVGYCRSEDNLNNQEVNSTLILLSL